MKRLFFFGYGSLMYPHGINGRGMNYQYVWEDIHKAKLDGFSRGMIAQYLDWLFYGIKKDKNSSINGTLMEIHSRHDLEALLRNEGALGYANPTYKVEDITNSITCQSLDLDNSKVLTLINNKIGEGSHYPNYTEHVYHGIQKHGEEFIEEFLQTGGISTNSEEIL